MQPSLIIRVARALPLFTLSRGAQGQLAILCIALLSLVACTMSRPTGGTFTTGGSSFLTDREFYIHDLGHRCVDVGPEASWAVGSPVYIFSCNGTAAQRIRVKEIDTSHDVWFVVGSPLLGGLYCIGVRGGQVVLDEPLELQACDATSTAQRFAVDGDSILMGRQTSGLVTREFAISPQAHRTPSRTPLVVESREASEAEYFRFEAVDRSSAPPTSGFVRVSTEGELDSALALDWGTVIEIDTTHAIELKGPFPKVIHAGVTLRGYRKYIDNGPEIHTCVTTPPNPTNPEFSAVFVITASNVRVTGFRFRGPANDPRCPGFQTSSSNDQTDGIDILMFPPPPPLESTAARIVGNSLLPPRNVLEGIFVDHMEISYFTLAAVETLGPTGGGNHNQDWGFCPPPPQDPRSPSVHIVGNYIHDQYWYGSNTDGGAFTLNQGNTFNNVTNHHIASDADGLTGYSAYDNFLLSGLSGLPDGIGDHDVDMHGACWRHSHWTGGISGDYFDLGWNTFLRFKATRTQRNIHQRGTPCRLTAIHDNVFRQGEGDAIQQDWPESDPSFATQMCGDPDPVVAQNPPRLLPPNTFNADDPTANSNLAVGDFDGDGSDDVFVGTGAGWYYASGARGEWRFLNRMPERTSGLLFGDIDGDDRTDVLALHGANIDVSWGGQSPWETINVVAWPLADLAVGDFDGNGTADLFLATGTQWFLAPGGRNWTLVGSFSDTRDQLLFGDFLHRGHTQILRIHQGNWEIIDLQQSLTWTVLGPAPASSVSGLVVGRFDADGFSEVAHDFSGHWEYTSPGRNSGWVYLRDIGGTTDSIVSAPVGRFLGGSNTDVVVWRGNVFYVAPSGRDPLQRISRQDMR